MSELGKRVAVAAVGIPAVLALVYLGGWYMSVPLAVLAAWATHELARLAAERSVRPLEWVAAPTAGTLVLLASWKSTFVAFAPHATGLLAVATFASLLGALWARGPQTAPLEAAAVTVFGATYIGLALAFAPLLHALPQSAAWDVPEAALPVAGLGVVAFPLAVTWAGDAAAYFAGSAWGRSKLAPTISPNKSWVGFWASVSGGALAGALWLLAFRRGAGADPAGGLVVFALIGGTVAVAAVLGDLVESLLKREAGVKDSGTFFPGHGGVLDRIDSLLFTIPSAYVALLLLGGTG